MGGNSNLNKEVVKAIPISMAPPAHVSKERSIRRPRGRPAGSKNKPKPPIIITYESPHALRAQALEVASECNVNESLIAYARRKQRGICMLSGVGSVADVTLRESASSVVTLHGRFEILSLLGSILPPPAPPGVTWLTVFLVGPQGQVLGGGVVGSLVASDPVVIMVATFMNATFDRMSLCDQDNHREASPAQAHHHFNHQGYLQHRHPELSEMYGVPPMGLQPEEFFPWAPTTRLLTKI